jgi:hypothetical protein
VDTFTAERYCPHHLFLGGGGGCARGWVGAVDRWCSESRAQQHLGRGGGMRDGEGAGSGLHRAVVHCPPSDDSVSVYV